jgi:CubicO group peptidase (beta-lactamase class C family)
VALQRDLDSLAAETSFSGVVRIDRGDDVVERAYGFANRGSQIPNTVDMRFGIASGAKGLTALTVVSLVEDGTLELGTRARGLLGDDLPLVGDDVTIESLLAHRSGIGDYLDEDASGEITDYVMPVPVHRLATTEDYVVVLDGHPPKFESFHELCAERVCDRAGMIDTAFLRSDELPERTAVGYLAADGLRTNVLHLPVRGSGDGGVYSTVADVRALWHAFFAGRIVSEEWVREMTRPRSEAAEHGRRYGLGFWLHQSSDTVILEGYDAGVSFRSLHDPLADATCTVVSNWTDGAWPIARRLSETLGL